MIKKKYNIEEYPFIGLVKAVYGVEDLSQMHIHRNDLSPDRSQVWAQESSTAYHKMFYEKLNENGPFSWSEIMDTYDDFLSNEVTKFVRVPFYAQKFPSLRVQLPGLKAINKWHFDSDKDHRHPNGEINFQIALTEMKKTYCTWVEPVPGCNYFVPLEMSPGEFYIFNGNKCAHGNKDNISKFTRLSFDFRIIPVKALEKNEILNKTATTKTSFTPGGYYKERIYNAV